MHLGKKEGGVQCSVGNIKLFPKTFYIAAAENPTHKLSCTRNKKKKQTSLRLDSNWSNK